MTLLPVAHSPATYRRIPAIYRAVGCGLWRCYGVCPFSRVAKSGTYKLIGDPTYSIYAGTDKTLPNQVSGWHGSPPSVPSQVRVHLIPTLETVPSPTHRNLTPITPEIITSPIILPFHFF